MPLSKSVLAKYPNTVFIETGLGDGDGLRIAYALAFTSIYSIELEQSRVDAFQKKVMEEGKHNIHLLCGDSASKLQTILESHTTDTGITLWLDAHPPCSPIPLNECPLLVELSVIAKYCYAPTILIDDMRLFSFDDRMRIETAVLEIQGITHILYEDSPVANNDIMVGKGSYKRIIE